MKGLFNFNIEELGPRKVESPIKLSTTHGDFVANYVNDDDFIRYNLDIYGDILETEAEAYLKNNIEKAGPREKLYFNPSHVNAGIVTCGGLCPGINDVIRAVVRCLWNRYGVRRIRGIRFGFKGLLPEYNYETIDLRPDLVDDIHKIGGSFLGTSRGGGNRVTEIADTVESLNMNMLFIVGGDGTQRGAIEVAEEFEKRKLKICVVGIPKTVDNDLLFIDRSFGFDTAVEKATEAVSAAHMEAHSHINGIGLIKLMGRESGFIATATALASHEANFCLIPEVPFELNGEAGFLHSLEQRIKNRQHAVVIIAEGAGQELLQATNKKDQSGNRRLSDIGVYLKDKITEYFANQKIHINLKYIDPSYQIRSAPATPTDSIYCERLGNNAVHAAMAGKTKLVIGLVHGRYVHIPTKLVIKERNRVNPEGTLWRDAIDATGQPIFMVNDREAILTKYRAKQL
ncbi:MAG: diphosphate--fructose-6-phosphate 1-phosphotransferase [Treponema sp. CETP13]|nr:MAG: diphosphate--fructose-6-phosphate 1-phosphotransferase [Treponema sp. CETP13]